MSFGILSAGEYPVVSNNLNTPFEVAATRGPGDVVDAPQWSAERYLLIRNELIKISGHGYHEFYIDPPGMVHQPPYPIDYRNPRSIKIGRFDFSPRRYLEGDYDEVAKRFSWSSVKYILPRLSGIFRAPLTVTDPFEDDANTENVERVNTRPEGEANLHYGVGRPYVRAETPDLQYFPRYPQVQLADYWAANKKYYFKLDPESAVDLVTDNELVDVQIQAKADPAYPHDEMDLVQGRFELGGGIVCGRREEGELVLYRFSCNQNTKDAPIEVFNPLQKLEWDQEKSNTDNLLALHHLRVDLLEHNVGLTENRLYVRMQNYKVKLDRPGETKALRDWYLLGPFYDPATQTYREALQRSDFIAGDGFDPDAAKFNPAEYVRRFIQYELPDGHLDILDERGRPLEGE